MYDDCKEFANEPSFEKWKQHKSYLGDCGHLDREHHPCCANGCPLQGVCKYKFYCRKFKEITNPILIAIFTCRMSTMTLKTFRVILPLKHPTCIRCCNTAVDFKLWIVNYNNDDLLCSNAHNNCSDTNGVNTDHIYQCLPYPQHSNATETTETFFKVGF